MKWIFIFAMAVMIPPLSFAQTDLRIVRKSILEDPLMDRVFEMAHETVAGGLNAGTAPQFAAHKNTVETDQETSLIQAVFQYVEKSGNRGYLETVVDGKTVLERLEMALEFLYTHRYSREYGLIYGATTADWGDVQPEHAWGVAIDENTHFAIDIYDNAMLAIALDNFVSLVSDTAAKDRWSSEKDRIIENVRRYLWDGNAGKFIPHLYLDGSPFPASFDENVIYYHGGTAVSTALLLRLLTECLRMGSSLT